MVFILEKGYCQIIDTEPLPEMLYKFFDGQVLRKCVLSSDRLTYYKDEFEKNKIITELLKPYCKKCRFVDGKWHTED
jgi:hypothetical protein